MPRLKERPEGEEEGGDYFVDLKEHAVSPTEEGVAHMERLLNVPNLYAADPRMARHFEQALRAHALYRRDRDYLVKDGEIVIVDEFTGRQMPGRRWSEGLHQAIEAKEGLRVQRESVTLATITFQNYFRLYDKLAGMTGTALTEAEEFYRIYGLDVVAMPTHRPMIRDDSPDLVYRSEPAKFEALIDEIEELQETGRPVLVGTISVEKSEILSEMLKRRGIRHEVLNAKYHEKEAEIVAQAGRSKAVTISTNMAGRGTDIILGGNPAGIASEQLHRQGLNPAEVEPEVYEAALEAARDACAEDHERVVAAGGLHIIGTERHDARRIDNQLRGRAGRQGDPGSSRFFLSLDDTLMKRFASDRVASLMQRFGLEDDAAIESNLVSRAIESAQARVEGYNFDQRKRVVEFDDVINKQRETIYAERDKVLRNEDLTETVRAFLDDEIGALLDRHLLPDVPPDDWDLDELSKELVGLGLDPAKVTPDALWDMGSREAILTALQELVDATLAEREATHGEEVWAVVERIVLLRAIDSLWVEHLTELDDMRRGIGLRGYGGEDPLQAFKKVAFSLYEELRGFIREQVAHTIFRVTVTQQPTPPPEAAQPMPGPGQPAASTGDGARADADPATAGAGPPGPPPRPAPPSPAIAGLPGRAPAAAPAGHAQAGTQRPMLVRQRAQVQEVPRTLTGSLARVGLAVVVGTVGVTGYTAFRIWQQGQVDEGDRPADAIVVLGAAQYDGVPSPVFRARLDHALTIFRRGTTRYLVVTGGRAPGDRFSEAQAARAYAVAHGVPSDRILDESTGRDTLESLDERGRRLPHARPEQRHLRQRSDPHAAGPADGDRPGPDRVRLAGDRQPDRQRPLQRGRCDGPRAGRPGPLSFQPLSRSSWP